jgi:hypothetical protein
MTLVSKKHQMLGRLQEVRHSPGPHRVFKVTKIVPCDLVG